ncbi:MAG: DNA integrity scanning protein DisA nucleotide-binding domain protein, partial [Chloroflexi bacterium]|nr:DNA integrity scanning protein DisA nucleotide-binding domain protein [Chloroflexota bacterium]
NWLAQTNCTTRWMRYWLLPNTCWHNRINQPALSICRFLNFYERLLRLTDFQVEHAQQKLAETSEFIGKLSGVDGAIIFRTDFILEGFGTEILMDKIKPSKVYKVLDPIKKHKEELDSEQFGMRHRSAMRLVSAVPDIAIFVVSQDGGISLIWNENGEVCFKTGVKTTNVNMVSP